MWPFFTVSWVLELLGPSHWIKAITKTQYLIEFQINPENNYLSTGLDEAWTFGQDVRC